MMIVISEMHLHNSIKLPVFKVQIEFSNYWNTLCST